MIEDTRLEEEVQMIEPQQEVGSNSAETTNEQKNDVAKEQLTAEDVKSIVDGAMGAYTDKQDVAINSLAGDVRALGESVELLKSSGEEEQNDEVMTVRADASQVETAKGALRILCTEGLLLVIVMSVVAGLLGWQIVSDRWRNNG